MYFIVSTQLSYKGIAMDLNQHRYEELLKYWQIFSAAMSKVSNPKYFEIKRESDFDFEFELFGFTFTSVFSHNFITADFIIYMTTNISNKSHWDKNTFQPIELAEFKIHLGGDIETNIKRFKHINIHQIESSPSEFNSVVLRTLIDRALEQPVA